MKRATKWAGLISVVLGFLSGSFAAEPDAFDKEKYPPEIGLITRMHRQEEARKKQAQYDVKVAIPDLETAEKEIEGLNNTVSNAMYMAEQAKLRENADQGLFQNVIIAAAL